MMTFWDAVLSVPFWIWPLLILIACLITLAFCIVWCGVEDDPYDFDPDEDWSEYDTPSSTESERDAWECDFQQLIDLWIANPRTPPPYDYEQDPGFDPKPEPSLRGRH